MAHRHRSVFAPVVGRSTSVVLAKKAMGQEGAGQFVLVTSASTRCVARAGRVGAQPGSCGSPPQGPGKWPSACRRGSRAGVAQPPPLPTATAATAPVQAHNRGHRH